MHTLKHELILRCHQYADSRIATARQAMSEAQTAANEESKSSVGDKYETGRSMMQIEGEKAAHQLAEATKLKDLLHKISPEPQNQRIGSGSLVITNTRKIFISIGIGKLDLNGEEILVVAPTSPLGKALMGCSVNDSVTFNGESMVITDVA